MFTPGYLSILELFREDDYKHDPWGTSMGWLGSLADVLYVLTGEVSEDYRPSAMLWGPEDLDLDPETGSYSTRTLYDCLQDGSITEDDMRKVYKVISRYVDWAKAAGRSY